MTIIEVRERSLMNTEDRMKIEGHGRLEKDCRHIVLEAAFSILCAAESLERDKSVFKICMWGRIY